ncbi:MAG: efflux RND transporter periplasmic adaptor subunit, partial [Steroidobacteraceae bacterium]
AARALAQMRSADADMAAVKGGGTHQEMLSTQAQLVKARAEQEAAQRNLQAVQRLHQTGAASDAELSAATNRLQSAQAELEYAQKSLASRYSPAEVERVRAQRAEAQAAYAAADDLLKNSNVRAARDGVVYSLPVRQGQFVNTGDLLLQVAELSKMQVRAFVDEPDIGRLAIGQQVTLSWDAIPGRLWVGAVTRVPTTVTMLGTRTVGEIICRVDNHDGKLIPNINVNVTVMTARHENALTVSREAMHQEGSQHYVFQIVNGVLQRRNVDTSVSNLTRIEVLSGLEDGAEVALGALNSFPLRSSMNVEVVQR